MLPPPPRPLIPFIKEAPPGRDAFSQVSGTVKDLFLINEPE